VGGFVSELLQWWPFMLAYLQAARVARMQQRRDVAGVPPMNCGDRYGRANENSLGACLGLLSFFHIVVPIFVERIVHG